MAIPHIITTYDTETTGKEFGKDRIVQIAMSTRQNGQVTKEINFYVNPEIRVTQGAYEVHKLSDAFLAKQPTLKDVYLDVIDFMVQSNSDEFGAYNSDFDTIMMSLEFDRVKRENPNLPSMHNYIKKKYPDFIPFKEREYHYNQQNNTYSYTGKTISEINYEISAIIDMFPCIDLMPPLVQAAINNNKGSKTIRESLDGVAEKLNIDISERQEAHCALIDSQVLHDCYEAAYDNGLLTNLALWLEFKFKGKEIPKFELKQENLLEPEIAQQAISFANRQNFQFNNTQEQHLEHKPKRHIGLGI